MTGIAVKTACEPVSIAGSFLIKVVTSAQDVVAPLSTILATARRWELSVKSGVGL
ncbi:MAG: hypothetical protein AAGE84_21110 [Cyanobacteria bacterium P01_G01_bin.39]